MTENPIDLATIADLRSTASEEQIKALEAHSQLWYNELITLKRKTETQLTSSHTRSFQSYLSYCKKEIEIDVYNEKIAEEKVWKTNATRFVQQIEVKILQAKQLKKGDVNVIHSD